MNFEEYIPLAVRTEKKLENLQINKSYVKNLLELFIVQTEILDGLKKEIFYNKSEKADINTVDWLHKIEELSYLIRKFSFRNRKNTEIVDCNTRLFHGVLGIMTESGELAQILLKALNGQEIDTVNLQEELVGDQNWYSAVICDEYKLNHSQGLKNNIDKLAKRYPEGFSDYLANNRNLEVERKELEKE